MKTVMFVPRDSFRSCRLIVAEEWRVCPYPLLHAGARWGQKFGNGELIDGLSKDGPLMSIANRHGSQC